MFISNKIYLGPVLFEMVEGRLNVIAEDACTIRLDSDKTRAIIDRLNCMEHGKYVYDLIKTKEVEKPKKLKLDRCPPIQAGDLVRYLPTGEICKVLQYGTLVDTVFKNGEQMLLGFDCRLTNSDFQIIERIGE